VESEFDQLKQQSKYQPEKHTAYRCIKRELVATQQRLQKVESELDQLKYQPGKHTAIPSATPPSIPLPPPPPAIQSTKLVILPRKSQRVYLTPRNCIVSLFCRGLVLAVSQTGFFSVTGGMW
jgi:hypothetical protein